MKNLIAHATVCACVMYMHVHTISAQRFGSNNNSSQQQLRNLIDAQRATTTIVGSTGAESHTIYNQYLPGVREINNEIWRLNDRNELRARLARHEAFVQAAERQARAAFRTTEATHTLSAAERAQAAVRLARAEALRLHHQNIAQQIRMRIGVLNQFGVPDAPPSQPTLVIANGTGRNNGTTTRPPSNSINNGRTSARSRLLTGIRRRPGRAGAIATGVTVGAYVIYRGIRLITNNGGGRLAFKLENLEPKQGSVPVPRWFSLDGKTISH